MRIALDVMGSDNFPAPDVEGAVQAAKLYGDTIVLVGDEAQIKAELSKHQTTGLNLEIHHTSDHITMEDKPRDIVRGKPESSVHSGLDLVEKGQADAFVSCGNTGAILAVATLSKLRRIKGVHRPALSSIIPFTGGSVIVVDLGGVVDCKPEWLTQFAIMGSVYAERVLKIDNPRVSLLSNGEEEGKGNALIHDTSPLLADLPINYIGNIEPKEMVKGGADVLVCDGFVGNLVIKSLEAMGMAIFGDIRTEIKNSWRAKIGALLMKPSFMRIYRHYDPAEIGGAPLLGVNGVVIIGHGRSDALAVKNAIRQAREAVQGNIVEAIREGISGSSGSGDE